MPLQQWYDVDKEIAKLLFESEVMKGLIKNKREENHLIRQRNLHIPEVLSHSNWSRNLQKDF